jgi:hypothetical protein
MDKQTFARKRGQEVKLLGMYSFDDENERVEK